MVNAAVHAARHGLPERTGTLAATPWRHLDSGSHNDEALTLHRHALDAALAVGDAPAEATACAT